MTTIHICATKIILYWNCISLQTHMKTDEIWFAYGDWSQPSHVFVVSPYCTRLQSHKLSPQSIHRICVLPNDTQTLLHASVTRLSAISHRRGHVTDLQDHGTRSSPRVTRDDRVTCFRGREAPTRADRVSGTTPEFPLSRAVPSVGEGGRRRKKGRGRCWLCVLWWETLLGFYDTLCFMILDFVCWYGGGWEVIVDYLKLNTLKSEPLPVLPRVCHVLSLAFSCCRNVMLLPITSHLWRLPITSHLWRSPAIVGPTKLPALRLSPS